MMWMQTIRSRVKGIKLESKYFNKVWIFVRKPIDCKWVYKKRRRVDMKVKTVNSRWWQKFFSERKGSTMRKLFTGSHA
jgi:hypothetical protein